jgi:two-component system chemotaxis response regulator CheY
MIADEGYDIIRSGDGMTALGVLSSGHFDLVITDLHMGRVSGIDILKRAKEQRPATVVIIVTGNINISPAMEAVWWGVDGYLLKPFTMLDLLESIAHCFHKRSLMKL